MPILNMYISKIVTDKANNTIAMKSHIGFLLAYLHFTLDHSKRQDQSYEHFNEEYVLNGGRYANITVVTKYEVAYGF